MSTNLSAEPETRNAGFGIVEVIVSMFLLSLMAMAFLPVLVQALQVSRVNASIATATQLLSADLDSARQMNFDCTSIPTTVPRPEGAFTVAGEWGTCDETPPATVSYTSRVENADEVLAQAVTFILVTE
jgi:type II secretory pathway pseudopilin PulG